MFLVSGVYGEAVVANYMGISIGPLRPLGRPIFDLQLSFYIKLVNRCYCFCDNTPLLSIVRPSPWSYTNFHIFTLFLFIRTFFFGPFEKKVLYTCIYDMIKSSK